MSASSPPLLDETRDLVGRTLRDKWHLDSKLGTGGMAAVYAATHRNGMRGAVKLLHPGHSHDAAVRTRFLREGYIANKVRHEGAVRVLDDDVDADAGAFLVMELLSGDDLQVWATKLGGALPCLEVMQAADQLLGVLEAAHAEGIVHRDIKPENVFLTTSGQVKVLDFGIARLADRVGDARATDSGLAIGTPAFMAPEQARGRRDLVGPWSDVWSVGATMFTLLTGEFVHVEETLSELLAASFTKPARSLGAALRGAPRPLVALVDRALLLSTRERWPSARVMRDGLRAAYRRIAGEAMPARCTLAPPERGECGSPYRGHAPPTPSVAASSSAEVVTLSPAALGSPESSPSASSRDSAARFPGVAESAPIARVPMRRFTRLRAMALLGGIAAVVVAAMATLEVRATSASVAGAIEPPNQELAEVAEVPSVPLAERATETVVAPAALESPDSTLPAPIAPSHSAGAPPAPIATGRISRGQVAPRVIAPHPTTTTPPQKGAKTSKLYERRL